MRTTAAEALPAETQEFARPVRALVSVSVVLPAYNLEHQIERTLKALFAQDYHEYEVIVVDDGSTDGTARIVEKYPHVRLIRHGANRGAAAARNTGIEAARHDVVYLLDADCIVGRDTLRRLVTRLLGNPRIGVVSGSYLSARDKGNLANRVYDVAERYRDYQPGVREYLYTTVSNAVMRKSAYRRIGGFGAYWRRIQDYEFTYRVHRAGYVNLHDPSIGVEHNNHREKLRSYYSHMFQIAKFGTEFRLRNRPAVPFSRYLVPSLPLFVLLSPAYFLLHVAKVCAENVKVRRVPALISVLPFVVWSRLVYTAGSVAGCAAYNRWKRAQGTSA